MGPQELPAPAPATTTHSVTLSTPGAKLIVCSSGALTLYEDGTEGRSGRIMAKANLQLPAACAAEVMALVWQRAAPGGHVSEAVVQWGPPGAPVAELLLKAAGTTAGQRWCQVRWGVQVVVGRVRGLAWGPERCQTPCGEGHAGVAVALAHAVSSHTRRAACHPASAPGVRTWPNCCQQPCTCRPLLPPQSLDQGFVLELHLSRDYASTAEVTVELEPSGHWFGGAHFIRQLWPLNQAAIELGPYYGGPGRCRMCVCVGGGGSCFVGGCQNPGPPRRQGTAERSPRSCHRL